MSGDVWKPYPDERAVSRETCKCIDDCGHRSAPAVTDKACADCGRDSHSGRWCEVPETTPTPGVPDNAGLREAPWRVGNHYGIHIYEGDRPVATFHREADARRCVEALAERDEAIRDRTQMGVEYDRLAAKVAAVRELADELCRESGSGSDRVRVNIAARIRRALGDP